MKLCAIKYKNSASARSGLSSQIRSLKKNIIRVKILLYNYLLCFTQDAKQTDTPCAYTFWVSLIAGLDFPLERGTGIWDWNIGLDFTTNSRKDASTTYSEERSLLLDEAFIAV